MTERIQRREWMTPREWDILDSRDNRDPPDSFAVIALRYKISRQRAHEIHTRMIALLIEEAKCKKDGSPLVLVRRYGKLYWIDSRTDIPF